MCYVNKVALNAINATFNIRKEDIRKRKIENFFIGTKKTSIMKSKCNLVAFVGTKEPLKANVT